jgi:hypothetical protein
VVSKNVARGVAVLLILSAGVWLWQTMVRPGLVGRYYAEAGWGGTPRFTVVDETPSTDRLATRATRLDDNPFSVTWTGFVSIPDAGDHTFSLRSAGEAWLFLDGRLVVDNGGGRTMPSRRRPRSGSPSDSTPSRCAIRAPGTTLRWS